jgi:hypothetical protein
MQSEIAGSLAAAFEEHRDDYGVLITIGGEEISAIVSESQFGRDLMEGGFADEGDLQVKFLLSDLTTIPALGNSVTFRARSFKVSRLGFQPGALVGEITCRPARR